MHIIPLAKSPSDITPCATGTPKISTAVECVRNKSYNTRASDEIQNAISRKLKGLVVFAISGFDMPKLFTLYLNYFVGSVYYQNACSCTSLNVKLENQMGLTWKVKFGDSL